MGKKKVLVFVSSLALFGGGQKSASNLVLKLSEKYDVYIISIFHSNNLHPFKGTYFTLNEKNIYRDMILRGIKVKRIINSISPDIIITYIARTSFCTILIKYLFHINIPLVIIINTNPDRHYKKRIYGKILIKLLYPLRKVDLLIPVSKTLKEILVNNYNIDKDKIIPLYNGVDINYVKQRSKERDLEYQEIFCDKNIIKFITVGRLSPEKGYYHLIIAFSIVVKKIPNSVLFILGEGPLQKYIEKLIKFYNLESKVFLLGFKKNPYKYLSKANIFVFSSSHEGLPNVLIEALACGLPVISTDCETGPREILEDGKYGLLVNVADSYDLAKKMIYLAMNKDLREKFSEKAFTRARKFNNQVYLSKWAHIIDYFTKINN